MPQEPPRKSIERGATVSVELENSSWVAPRGVRHTEWFVKVGDGWTRLTELPEVLVTLAEEDPEDGSAPEGFVTRPPGCQYLCRFRVVLPVGTALRRRVSMPRDARRTRRARGTAPVGFDLRRDILSHFRYAKPPLSVLETHFRVGRRGLVAETEWERAIARKASGG